MVSFITRSRSVAIAAISTLAAVIGCLAIAAPAQAFPESGYLHTCNNKGSGDVCWWNPNDAHTLDDIRSNTQYNRDQVCAKARYNTTTGAVDPQSACASGTDYVAAQFDGTHQLKKGYGYWAGNGGQIWIRVRAHY